MPNAALTGLTGFAVDRDARLRRLRPGDRGNFFAVKDGLWFYEQPSEKYPGARRIHARLGKQLDITLVTSDTENDGILAILEGLDVAALNAMAVEPLEVFANCGLVTAPPVGGDPQDALRVGAMAVDVTRDSGPGHLMIAPPAPQALPADIASDAAADTAAADTAAADTAAADAPAVDPAADDTRRRHRRRRRRAGSRRGRSRRDGSGRKAQGDGLFRQAGRPCRRRLAGRGRRAAGQRSIRRRSLHHREGLQALPIGG